jgi:hypothetical protein
MAYKVVIFYLEHKITQKGIKMSDGTGGSGGTINANANPSIANPISFVFLNGNSGTNGSTAQNTSATNANVGIGGGGVAASTSYGSATGGSGGAGSYAKITYGPGQIPQGNVIAYIIGAAGSSNGTNGGIKITWS